MKKALKVIGEVALCVLTCAVSYWIFSAIVNSEMPTFLKWFIL